MSSQCFATLVLALLLSVCWSEGAPTDAEKVEDERLSCQPSPLDSHSSQHVCHVKSACSDDLTALVQRQARHSSLASNNSSEVLLPRVVVATTFNNAYNRWIPHLAHKFVRLGVEGFILHAQDKLAASFLEEVGLGCSCYYHDSLATTPTESVFGSASFKGIGSAKMRLAEAVIRTGVTLVMSEADVAWFTNPVPSLMQLLWEENLDFAASGIPGDLNIGFFIMRPTPPSVQLLSQLNKRIDADPGALDQAVFNDLVQNGDLNLSFQMLDRHKYALEQHFLEMEDRHIKLPYQTVTENVAVAHLVGARGTNSKIYVMQEHQQFEAWSNHFSSENKYLAYLMDRHARPQNVVDTLFVALTLAKHLDRILIMPYFDCEVHQAWRSSYYQSSRVNANCTLERVIDISVFMKYFGSNIRESSFFCNMHTPEVVRRDVQFVEVAHLHSLNLTHIKDLLGTSQVTTLHLGLLSGTTERNALVFQDEDTQRMYLEEFSAAVAACPPNQFATSGYGPICVKT